MNKEFLYTLLDGMSVSGHEIPMQKQVIREMTPFCHRIDTDCTGNVVCVLNPDSPFKVLLTGHIDEIGLIVTQIQSDGLLRVTYAGGIHPYQYPGHQVVVHGSNGPVYGTVIANDNTDKKDLKAKELYIDIGARDAAEARNYVNEGDPAHFHSYHQEMLGGFLSARAVDDRGGAFIVLEALKRAKELGCRIGVYAATTVGEETSMRGAHWACSRVDPNLAIAVDVTFATDYPGTEPECTGDVKLGSGPVLCHSSIVNKTVNNLLRGCAKAHNIPIQQEVAVGRTGTDADKMHFAGNGHPTALVSLPLRYMHSPSEVCHLDDIKNTVELLARFLCSLDGQTGFDPFCCD